MSPVESSHSHIPPSFTAHVHKAHCLRDTSGGVTVQQSASGRIQKLDLTSVDAAKTLSAGNAAQMSELEFINDSFQQQVYNLCSFWIWKFFGNIWWILIIVLLCKSFSILSHMQILLINRKEIQSNNSWDPYKHQLRFVTFFFLFPLRSCSVTGLFNHNQTCWCVTN